MSDQRYLLAGLLIAAIATQATAAPSTPADHRDAELAYAQCVRDHGYTEFPDPEPDGGFRFLIDPENVARFKAAAVACRDLSPEGLRDDAITPERLDALLKLSQCIRENGVPEFPDPDTQGVYDLRGIGIGPDDARLKGAMVACHTEVGQAGRIAIGG